MAEKAKIDKLNFRPHFKTHQSAGIANWFRDHEVKAIAVSSVTMAAYFARNGWDDITIAFPVNLPEMNEINTLAKEISLRLILEDPDTLLFLQKNLRGDVGAFIKIDTGAHRTGADPCNVDLLNQLVEGLTPSGSVRFKGFLSHAGHTYKAKSKEQIIDIHQQELSVMRMLKEMYKSAHPQIITSIGDTPSCSICDDFDEVDEIRPGNFVFYDVMQAHLGSCTMHDIAVALACPVVAVHSARYEAVLYGGAIHLSKEHMSLPDGSPIFGYLAKPHAEGWEILPTVNYVKSLSQEHGIIKLSGSEINRIRTGDIILVLPVHSCLCAHLMQRYMCLDGQVIEMMGI